MMRPPAQFKVLTLATVWLLAISLWVPMSVLNHLDKEAPLQSSSAVQLAAVHSGVDCNAADCADSMSHMNSCDTACHASFNAVSSGLILALSGDTYAGVDTKSYKALSPAAYERPPKRFV